jgi:GNAT superfamily N-acetyltransferase
MQDAVIRLAEPEDAPALSSLGVETFLDTFVRGFGLAYPETDLQPFLAASYAPEAYARMIADPALRVWIAEHEGAAVAYATAGENALPHPEAQPGEGELKRLYLRREAQGSGLAVRLFEATMAWLDPAGDRRTWIGVWSGNLRAQRFYARYGFAKVGEYDYRVGNSVDHEFIFRRG